MKISPKHYSQLKDMLDEVIAKHGLSAKGFVEYYATFGLTPKRALWDVLWTCPATSRQAWFDEIYKYANDDHVYTALKKYASES